MILAVAQHQLRPTPAQDLEALVGAAASATARGARIVVLPAVAAVQEGPLSEELWRRLDEAVPGGTVVMLAAPGVYGGYSQVCEIAPLGRVALLLGDAAIDVGALPDVARQSPAVAVVSAQAESELQAEAFLELAIGLSTSLAALVVVVEADGATMGEAGHGGSAVLHLGEVLAEAVGGDDLLVVDVEAPVGPPEPRGPLPELPPLLAQRLAAHRGQKLRVDYPADLD